MALRIAVAIVTLFPVVTMAQGPAARDYLNTPVDQLRFFVDFLGSNGETAAESDIPLPNNVTVTRNAFVSLLWSFPLRDRYTGLQVGGGYARVKVNGALGSAQTGGWSAFLLLDAQGRSCPGNKTWLPNMARPGLNADPAVDLP